MIRVLAGMQRLSGAPVAAVAAGGGVCGLRGVANATPAPAQAKPEAMPDALDQEFDRGDDEAMARVREVEYAARSAALREAGLRGQPVDLECEFDRDDPDAVDPSTLYAEAEPGDVPEVDLDTEFDRDDPLLADKEHLWDCPDPPCPADIDAEEDLMADEKEFIRATYSTEEQVRAAQRAANEAAGTLAGSPPHGASEGPFGQGGRRAPGEPDPRVGQYREKRQAA